VHPPRHAYDAIMLAVQEKVTRKPKNMGNGPAHASCWLSRGVLQIRSGRGRLSGWCQRPSPRPVLAIASAPALCQRPHEQRNGKHVPSRELAGPHRMTRPNDIDEAGSARPERHLVRAMIRRPVVVAPAAETMLARSIRGASTRPRHRSATAAVAVPPPFAESACLLGRYG
jgi:hypothetical protein